MRSKEQTAMLARHRISYGLPAVELSNGMIRAVVIPSIGGRIMSFAFEGFDFMWRNRALEGRLFSAEENTGDGTLGAWKNYGGSKTWPAPQGWGGAGEWAGPPDAVLDSGQFELLSMVCEAARCSARVRSAPDERSGVQITRELSLHTQSTHATLHLEMRNVSDEPRTWGLWDVVQIDARSESSSGAVTFNDKVWMHVPLNERSCFERGFITLYGPKDNSQWQPDYGENLMSIQYRYQLGKIGIDATAGWVAVVAADGDHVFCQRFRNERESTYPDGGSTVECWTTGLGETVEGLDYAEQPLYHLECEVLGPLRTMLPSQEQQLDIEWYAARCPGPIRQVTPAGCCSRRLAVSGVGQDAQITGLFGVFHIGQLRLVWLDDRGEEIGQQVLGAVDPRTTLRLDERCCVPGGACQASLRVSDSDGQCIGELDRCDL